jgi:hypothetical protein
MIENQEHDWKAVKGMPDVKLVKWQTWIRPDRSPTKGDGKQDPGSTDKQSCHGKSSKARRASTTFDNKLTNIQNNPSGYSGEQ